MSQDNEDKITSIEKVDGSKKSKEIAEEIEPVRQAPDKEKFDGFMQKDTPAVVNTDKPESVSLMEQIRDINKKVVGVTEASPDTVLAQATEVIKQIETVKEKLATPNLEIKPSVQTVLNNKLSHIDESLKVALNRAGVEYTPQAITPATSLAGPIEKFIGLLTHGQYQLQRLSNDVAMMGDNNKAFSPAQMLAVQIKVGYVQQEVELFTNILNKSLESIKTIMNVQI